MNRRAKIHATDTGVKGFFERSKERARKLDRGEEPNPEVVISFEDPADMISVLTVQRIRLLNSFKGRPTAVATLATTLKRDTRAVKRDLDVLERFGLVRSRLEKNPGHGRRRIVEPRASTFKLLATIGASV